MTEYKLAAAARAGGKPNHFRREGRIPAVVYGHRRQSEAISVDAAAFSQVLGHGGNVLINLAIGDAQDTVMIKDIQRHPLRGHILHVDFLAVALDELLTASVPLVIVGDALVMDAGGIVQHQLREVEVECLPAQVPGHITVDVAHLTVGEHVAAGDLQMPPGVKLMTAPDEVVVTVVAPRVAEVETTEEPEEPAEGEEAPPAQPR